jgi:predicted enzyme related to lactoylglutathione lyase
MSAACGKKGVLLEEGGGMANGVVHFELQGPDPEGVAKFYGQLFGWHTESVPGEEPYILVDTHAGKGINGGFGKAREGQPPSSTIYVEAGDVKAALKKAESLGAKTVVPYTVIPNMVTFALFADPQGAVVGLVQSDPNQQAPGVSSGNNRAVDWFEILSSDPKKAWDFYGKLFGWKVTEAPAEGFVYGMVEAGDSGIGGGIGGSQDGQPRVNIYASVDDLQKYVTKAESLGAKTIMPPTKVAENTTIAIIADPQGTTFGLYEGM